MDRCRNNSEHLVWVSRSANCDYRPRGRALPERNLNLRRMVAHGFTQYIVIDNTIFPFVVLVQQEITPEEEGAAERAIVICGNSHTPDVLWLVCFGNVERASGKGAEVLECPALPFPVDEILGRRVIVAEAAPCPDCDQPVGLRIGWRRQQRRVIDCENCSVGADTQCDCEKDD